MSASARSIACILLLASFLPARAANYYALATGNWNNAGIWVAGAGASCASALPAKPPAIPNQGDDVTICAGMTVTVDAASSANTVVINGTLNGSSNTLTIDNTPAVTLNAGGAFNPGTGTVALIRDNATSVAAGTAAVISFNNLVIMNGVNIGGSRTYTLGAAGSSIATMNVGNLSATPTGAGGGVRVLTLDAGTVTTLNVTGTTQLAMQGNNDSTVLNSPATFNSRQVTLGGGGSTGTDTWVAAAGSAVTLGTGLAAGTVVTRNANGAFTASTSTVTVSPAASVALNAGTLAFNNLTVTMAANNDTLILGSAITVDGAFNTTVGTVSDAGNQITGNAAGSMSMASGTSLVLGTAAAATVFPANFITGNVALNANSTVTYNSDQAQVMSATPVYGHVVLAATAAVNKTPAAGMNIDGNLTIGANNTLLAGAFTHALAGNFTNNGTYVPSTGTITFDGTSTAAIAGTTATTFNNMTVNKPGATLNITTSPTITGTLTLTAGTVSTGANKVTLGSAGTLAGVPAVATASSANVLGNFEKVFPAGAASFTYPVGDGTNYTPIRVAFAAGPGGNFTATTPAAAAADHPDTTFSRTGIAPGNSVNRYWTLKNSTIKSTYDITLYYLASDLDPSTTPTHVVRGQSCATSGAVRTCNPWGRFTGSLAGNSIATTAGLLLLSGDGDADFSAGQSATPRFIREKEFIYSRELY